jgi:hypothetical protein
MVILLRIGCLEVGRDICCIPEDCSDFCQIIVDMFHMKIKQERLDTLIEPSAT